MSGSVGTNPPYHALQQDPSNMSPFTYTAGERMKNKFALKNFVEGVVDQLMDHTISDSCFTDISLLWIRYIELLIGAMGILKSQEVESKLKNIVL